jgi:hypothetical protein
MKCRQYLLKISLVLVIFFQVPFLIYLYGRNSLQFTLSMTFCLSLLMLLTTTFLGQYSSKTLLMVLFIQKFLLNVFLILFSCFLLTIKNQLAYFSYSSNFSLSDSSCSCTDCPKYYSGIIYVLSLAVFLTLAVIFN